MSHVNLSEVDNLHKLTHEWSLEDIYDHLGEMKDSAAKMGEALHVTTGAVSL